MAETRGVWSLSEAWGEKSTNSWVPVRQVWIPNDGFGYSMHQLATRLTRTNINTGIAYNSTGDQVYNPASHGGTGFSSGDKGYFLGSSPSPGTSWVGKVTYATGVHQDPHNSPGGPYMPMPGYVLGSFPGDTKGYVFAGVQSGSSSNGTSKMEYSSESWAAVPGSIAWTLGGQWYVTGSNNGNGVGYAIAAQQPYGQYGGGKLPYSTETWSTYPASPGIFPIPGGIGGFGNKTNTYLTGGGPSTAVFTSTYKFAYSSETWARNPSANLILGLYQSASYSYNSSKGCLCGGIPMGAYNPSNPNPYKNSQAFTLTYSTDTWDATSISADSDKFGAENGTGVSAANNHSSSAGMDGFSRWMDGAGETPDSGYAVSGRNSPSSQGTYNYSTAAKVDFTSDTSSATPSLDSFYMTEYNFGGGSVTNGYVIGGTDGSPSNGESNATKITYSTETRSDLPGIFNFNPYACFAMTHGNIALYAAGGKDNSNYYSNIYKMNYSDETFAILPTIAGAYTQMNPYTWNGATTSVGNKGYFITGKRLNSYRSDVSRINFSNDTAEGLYGNWFPVEASYNRAISESTAAYSVGGRTGNYTDISSIYKFTYSSETCSSVPQTLTADRYNTQTMGNQTQGYIAGGNKKGYNPLEYKSNIDKFVYSTSTVSAIGNLPGNQAKGSGISPRNDNLYPSVITKTPTTTPTPSTAPNPAVPLTGYWAGGTYDVSPRPRSITERVTFATDTTARVPAANTSEIRYAASGTSSTTKGYANGGNDTTNAYARDYINALTYSNDTWANIPGALTNTTAWMYAVNNTTHSYAGGGMYNSGFTLYSQIDKLTFSTETASKNIAQLASNRYFGTGVGNATAGYFCGGKTVRGWADPKTTQVNKLTYSTDSLTNLPSLTVIGENSPTGYGVGENFSFGKEDVGYVCGGHNSQGNSYVTKNVNKITYATETRSLAPDLWGGRFKNEACSSNEAGYYSGGRDWSDPMLNEGYKMPYSTETWTAGPSLPLSTARYECTSFSAVMNANGNGSAVPTLI
tara:strand:+ start:30 stop:3107 length:3078 start_codon:yes stop_codon:yes gene_type:complete